LYVDYELKIDC